LAEKTNVMLRLLAAFTLVLALSHCGTPSPPECRWIPRESRGDPRTHLEAARDAWRRIGTAGNPAAKAAARSDYNRSVARLFDQLRCGEGSYHQRAERMGTAIDTRHSLGARLAIDDLDALVPASSISTKDIGPRHVVEGVGVP